MKQLLALLLLASFAAPLRADITTNLALQWKLDEGTSTSAADSSGNSRTGTLNGGATWQAGRIGPYSVRTDGTDDYISGSCTALNSSATGTIACWINRAGGTVNTFGFEVGSNYFNAIWFSDNVIYIRRAAAGDGTSGAVNGTGWHHVCYVYDGGASPKDKLYVDGVLQTLGGGASSDATFGATTGNTFWVGRSNVNGYGVGDYDEVRVYSRALSQSDVTELYQYGARPHIYYYQNSLNRVFRPYSLATIPTSLSYAK